MFFTFPKDARRTAERQAVEFGVEIGEYAAWSRCRGACSSGCPQSPPSDAARQTTYGGPGSSALSIVPKASCGSFMTALPPGCSFAPRCGFAESRCREAVPREFALESDHAVRCLRAAAGEIELAAPRFA